MRIIPETPKERLEYQKLQDKARAKVRRAVLRGELVNLKTSYIECTDCKNRRAMFYDHRDYNFPLEVIPVCRSCNSKRGPTDCCKEVSKYELRELRSKRFYLPDGSAISI
jgi:hypothetical protein